MHSPVIRKLERADFDPVAQQMMRLNQIHVQACPEIFRVLTFENAVDYLNQKIDQERIFVAVIENLIVGYIHFEVSERAETIFSHARKLIYLHQIFVVDKYRRQGIGTLLIAKMKSMAQEIDDLKWIWFDVCNFNASAIGFYQKHGFEIMGNWMSLGKTNGRF